MKKLLITSSILSALIMTGCAGTTTTPTIIKPVNIEPVNQKAQSNSTDSDTQHQEDQSKQDQLAHLQVFQCDNDAIVVVDHMPKHNLIKAHINAPSWNLKNAAVDMKAAPAASGERFINDLNPMVKYEWHSKDDMGVLSVIDNTNKTSQLNCEKLEIHQQ